VARTGAGVSGFAPGARVAYATQLGAYAEYTLVPQDGLVPVPDGVDLAAAAAVSLQGMAAHYLTSRTHPVAEGDTVVARLIVRGTHTGFHPRMPEPTGRSCEVEQIWILTVRDGKISEIRAVSDRLGMFLQLGWDWPAAG
jgi:hypothetical protein